MSALPGSESRQAVAPIAGTWLAFCLALVLALPQPPDPLHLLAGAVIGVVLILVGFRAASRSRPAIAPRTSSMRARLSFLSFLSGAVVGALLLLLLVALARVEPALRSRFAGRLSEPVWRPWALAFESSILEEVIFRLFAMSVVGWIVTRIIRRPGAAFAWALVVSTLLFGLAHVPAWISAGTTPPLLIAAVILLNGIAAVLLGWIFWRWGLVYAILCHFAGDIVVQSLGTRLLG